MDCFLFMIALIPISFISETSVFSILPNLEDEEIVESSAKTTSAWSQPFAFKLFKIFFLVNFYS